MRYRAIFTADVHMSNALPHARPSRAGRTDRLDHLLAFWDQVAEHVGKTDAQAVFVVGDLFDKSIVDAVTLSETVGAIRRVVGAFQDVDVSRFIVVPGNHDASSKDASRFIVDALSAVPGVFVAKARIPFCPNRSSVAFYPIPYGPLAATHEEFRVAPAASDDDALVLLLHHAIVGADMGSRVCDVGISAELATSGFDYVLAGHFHDHQGFGPAPERSFYLGAPIQHTFGDAGKRRGFWDLTWEDKILVDKVFIESCAPRFHVADSWDDVPVALAEARRGDYLRIKVRCTHAEWSAKERDGRSIVAELESGGLRVDLEHVPVYHHGVRSERLSTMSEAAPPTPEDMIRAYLRTDGVVTGGLDVRVLEQTGFAAVEAARRK